MTGDGTKRRLDELESRIERQQERLADQRATITAQRERIERLEAERTASMGDSPAEDDSRNGTRGSASRFSRRGILQGLGVVGLLGFGAGTASAAEPRGEVGTGDRPVDMLYLDALSGPITDGADLTTLVGDGLAIDDGTLATTTTGPSVAEHGNVVAENPSTLSFEDNVDVVARDDEIEINVSDSDTNTQTDVSDDGTTVVSSTSDVDFGDNLVATDDGDGSATVDADVQAATNWEDGGSDLLTTSSPFTGIDVEDVSTNSLDGGISNGTGVTDIEGDGLSVSSGSLGLTDDSVTVAGNVVSLGGSIGVSHGDLDAVDQIAGSNLHASGGALNVDSQLDLGDGGNEQDNPSLKMSDFTFESPSDNSLELIYSSNDSALFAPGDSSTIDLGESTGRWNTVYCESLDESSDARLKEDVADLGDGLERLDCIRPVSYQWKDADDPERRLGFVAQELDDAVPEAVSRPDDEDGHLGINNTMVTAVAVSAIQDQQDLIEDLDEECADLQSENEAFRERCADLETRLAAVEDKLSTESTSQAVADD